MTKIQQIITPHVLIMNTYALSSPTALSHSSLLAGRCFPSCRYLGTVDVHATHAPAAVYQEDELSLGFLEAWLHSPQVRAEVEHDDSMVGDVLVQPLPDDFRLKESRRELKRLIFPPHFNSRGIRAGLKMRVHGFLWARICLFWPQR